MDDSNVLHFVVTDSKDKEIVTTHEHLRSPSTPDVGWIPNSVPEYGAAAKSLSHDEVEALTPVLAVQ